MSSNLTLYYLVESSPCRTVLMTAKVLGIDLNLKILNLMAGEHLKPEFLKINPMHTIPTLTDGDFVLYESRVIITYLAEKYGKNDSLYPKDPKKRALIDQRLYFDLGSLYQPIINYYRPIYYGAKSYDETKLEAIKKAFETLNTFLNNSKYVAGDCLTLADIAIISTIATAISVMDYDLSPYPNVKSWFKHVKASLPDYKGIIEENAQKLKVMIDGFIAKNNK